MSGFKNFLLRGNLVELAVAFIMGGAFATVVTAMVDVIMDLVGKAGGVKDFSNYEPKGVSVGAFITALISFVILAAVVYFLIVTPYTKAKERYFPSAPPGTPEDIKILGEIRDLLATQQGGAGGTGQGGTTNPGVTDGPGTTNPGV
ncbi:MscL family protein [Nocardioides ochotonae]|uniref:MscL family protein n=1 Tax=Nocardioides ochotonae TaxID=2685869 RepID=UPI00140CC3C7